MALPLYPCVLLPTSCRLGTFKLSSLITSILSCGAPLGNLGGMALPLVTTDFHPAGLVMHCRSSVRHQQMAVFIKSPYVHQTLSSCCPSFVAPSFTALSLSFMNSLHNVMSRSFQRIQSGRPHGFNIEGNEDPETFNDRFSDSSMDSDARFDRTTRSNLQALRPMLGRAVTGQRRSCGKRVLLIILIVFIFTITVAMLVPPCSFPNCLLLQV